MNYDRRQIEYSLKQTSSLDFPFAKLAFLAGLLVFVVVALI